MSTPLLRRTVRFARSKAGPAAPDADEAEPVGLLVEDALCFELVFDAAELESFDETGDPNNALAHPSTLHPAAVAAAANAPARNDLLLIDAITYLPSSSCIVPICRQVLETARWWEASTNRRRRIRVRRASSNQ